LQLHVLVLLHLCTCGALNGNSGVYLRKQPAARRASAPFHRSRLAFTRAHPVIYRQGSEPVHQATIASAASDPTGHAVTRTTRGEEAVQEPQQVRRVPYRERARNPRHFISAFGHGWGPEEDQFDTIRLEDVIPAQVLEDELIDRDYLEQVLRDPQRFLPPPKIKPEVKPRPVDRDPEPVLVRRAKATGLVVAAALLAGSVVTAATLTGHRAPEHPHRADALEMTGAAALGGFAVPADEQGPSRPERTGTSSTPATPGPSTPVAPPADPSPGGARPRSAAGSHPAPGSGTDAKVATEDKIAAVRDFYTLVDSKPEDALRLLAPDLVGEQPGDLVRAWSSMRSVRLEDAHLRPDGAVVAIVQMLQPDGGRLRVTQLLRLADGPRTMISEARLLSAQRM
jgi:hypothetical protein